MGETIVIAIPIIEKGVALGVATLDGGGKVPLDQIPASITDGVKLVGTWDADANDPELSNGGGGGNPGEARRVSVAGTTEIDGEDDWQIGDLIVNADTYWFKIDNTETYMVKGSAGDATPGYLDSKVDDATLQVIANLLQVKDGGITVAKLGTFYRIPLASFASETDTDIAVQTGKHRIPIMIDGNTVAIRAMIETAPTGSSIILDVNKNGVTIFTNQANRPTIADGANDSGEVTNMDITAIAKGDYFTLDIDQVGSTTPGQNLTVLVVGR